MKTKGGIIEAAMKYRQIVILIVSLMFFLGIYALMKMPKQEFPVFTVRQGVVIVVYPGATSDEVEEQVTEPLEDFIFEFKEVKKTKTHSLSRDGMAIVFVELNDDITDKDEFWAKFKHRAAAFKSELPTGVLALVTNDDFGDTSAMLITIESKDKTYRELENYLDELKDRLRSIDAVSNLRTFGVQKEQISVYLDPAKLARYAIGNTTLATKLLAQGFTTMSGRLVQRRQQHRGENRDDRNDDQQLDQGECSLFHDGPPFCSGELFHSENCGASMPFFVKSFTLSRSIRCCGKKRLWFFGLSLPSTISTAVQPSFS